MSDEQQDHEDYPLTLNKTIQKSIDKLVQHKIISKSSLAPLSCSSSMRQIIAPPASTATAALHSAIHSAQHISRLRHDSKLKFWSCGTRTSAAEKSQPRMDRINIAQAAGSSGTRTTSGAMSTDSNTITLTPLQFKQRYLYTNTPCIIQNQSLPITNQWYTNNQTTDPDENDNSSTCTTTTTDWFLQNIGEETSVPIRIHQEGYQDGRAAECLTSKMTMKQWIIQTRQQNANPKNYLKDWHCQSLFQEELYPTPIIFKDVLNPFLIENEGGDYRFVYWGCKGSSTGIHSDVLNSYSWSFNVVGKKRWTFYHPDDGHGSGDDALVVIQNKGEMMYVPSGWRHSVENLEETISVNHNWTMVGALDMVFECLVHEIGAVEEEMDEWGMTGELSRVRENMLRGCVGMDVSTFCVLVISCFVDCLIDLTITIRDDDHGAEDDAESSDESIMGAMV